MQYEMKKQIAADPQLRAQFNALAGQTFGLSFENWYQNGCWKENYRPYTLFCDDKAAANVSVSPIEFKLDETMKKAVQLGTVMTAPEHRNKGLAAFLMQTVLMEYRPGCDWMFLFANESVLDFYPKFGFTRAWEYRCVQPVAGGFASARRLDCSRAEDLALLQSHYAESNPFSALTMENNWNLVWFYASSFLKDCIFFVPEQDAVVIAEQDGETMLCYDIFCPKGKDREQILRAAAQQETSRVEFGFFPSETAGCSVEKIEDDSDALFLLGKKEDPFAERPLRFPLLSHT